MKSRFGTVRAKCCGFIFELPSGTASNWASPEMLKRLAFQGFAAGGVEELASLGFVGFGDLADERDRRFLRARPFVEE